MSERRNTFGMASFHRFLHIFSVLSNHLAIIRSYIRKGDYLGVKAEALEIFRKAVGLAVRTPMRVVRRILPESPKKACLKRYLRKRDYESAFRFGRELLETNPLDETALYAVARGALHLGKYDEVLSFTKTAVEAYPDVHRNWNVRGQALLDLGRHQEAFESLTRVISIRPEDQSAWAKLDRIRLQRPEIEIPIPRSAGILTGGVKDAFATRDWERFDLWLKELWKHDPFAAEYWFLTGETFRSRLRDPVSDWETFCRKCDEAGNPFAFVAFCAYFNALLLGCDFKRVLQEYPNFWRRYRRPCPVKALPGLCATLIREKKYDECVKILDEVEQRSGDVDRRRFVHLKTFAYRWICQNSFSTNSNRNRLSNDVLKRLLELHYPESGAGQVLSAFTACWNRIYEGSSRSLMDVRYDKSQEAELKSAVAGALSQRKGFSLIRIGDADSYAFLAADTSSAEREISALIERTWWGRSIDPSLRRTVVDEFISSLTSADIVGMPGPLRMARDLKVVPSTDMNSLDEKYHILFSRMEMLVREGKLQADALWVDEYCNFRLCDSSYLSSLIDTSKSVVLVTCFNVPRGSFFDHKKISVIKVPPHARVASKCESEFGSRITPEVMGEIRQRLQPLLEPGVLLLVSAGFAGKSLLALGKAAGAVSLDFGSAIDDLLGFKTRSSELHVQSTW